MSKNLSTFPAPLLDENAFWRSADQVPHQRLSWPAMEERGIQVWVRRDDQVHPRLSGNKFYKLFYNLRAARQGGYQHLATFGGAYSNHLYAVAMAGHLYGFNTHGLVRGERPARLSPTLEDARSLGMRLHFVSRRDYRDGAETALAQIRSSWGEPYLVPEGGANRLGCQGARLIGESLDRRLKGEYDAVCLPCGTGGTLAGVACGLPPDKVALGFSVLKGEGGLGADVALAVRAQMAQSRTASATWRLISGFHGGGYGRKLPQTLQRFWHRFEAHTGLALDPVYTLKMCWGVEQLALRGYWARGTRLVLVHTGGLQGRRGFFRQAPPLPYLSGQ